MAQYRSIQSLFEEEDMVKVCAPMVRYSKLPFRMLVRKYNCDVCFTPMIMSESFVQSEEARKVEFTTNKGDRPLIVQFAANNPSDFVSAAEIVSPYCDGVDLNCGCPQRWAMQAGLGSALLKQPNLIRDIILQLRNRIADHFSVSAKIRILPDIRKSVDVCKQLEAVGATFLTVHGRTPDQRNEPVNREAMKEIRRSVSLPLIANGGVKTKNDAVQLQQDTGYQGVMCAQGILENPALFTGITKTPESCLQTWINIALEDNMHFILFHRHLIFMLEKVLPKSERRIFNNLKNKEDVLHYISNYFDFEIPNYTKT